MGSFGCLRAPAPVPGLPSCPCIPSVSLDHRPSRHLQQDMWTLYSHGGRTGQDVECNLISCSRDAYPLTKSQKPSSLWADAVSELYSTAAKPSGPVELRARPGSFFSLFSTLTTWSERPRRLGELATLLQTGSGLWHLMTN